jgi:hypothetical protein
MNMAQIEVAELQFERYVIPDFKLGAVTNYTTGMRP